MEAMATAVGRTPSDVASFGKLAEGGFNRVFEAVFNDGKRVLARLPYPSTMPKHYAVASEVATMDFLRLQGIRTPKVHAWSSTQNNGVGSEYIIMWRLDGQPLGATWYSLTSKQQHKVIKQIVELETRLMSLDFPACGSIYYQKDLHSERKTPLSGQKEFCIGPIAHYSWWHGERSRLDLDRGPCPCTQKPSSFQPLILN